MDTPLMGSAKNNYRFFYGVGGSVIFSLILLLVMSLILMCAATSTIRHASMRAATNYVGKRVNPNVFFNSLSIFRWGIYKVLNGFIRN